ncbi:MAG: TIGR04282 family arsenosugar biosynthesis glycosyltransferase [Pseudomonadota bacterium]
MADAAPLASARHVSGAGLPGVWAPRLVIMARTAIAGRVKTRLAREIGAARATAFYRTTSQVVIARLAGDQRWQTWLACTPDTAIHERTLPQTGYRVAQGVGDLGARMQRVFDTLPPGPVVIVGTDIPGIDSRAINAAFRALRRSDAVLGPADDGGYWLVGHARRRPVARLFVGVQWSTETTLTDTEKNLPEGRVAHLATLEDVDDAASWRRLQNLGARRVVPITARGAETPGR